MLDYKLALKLKDAGFPQGKGFNQLYPEDTQWLTGGHPEEWKNTKGHNIHEFDEEKKDKLRVYAPTLSELVEACGLNPGFILGWTSGNEWRAENTITRDLEGKGKTPEIAVSNLWLKLNEKTKNN